jgi:hypothetical protein
MADEKMLQHILGLARADVHRGQSLLALGHLKSILEEVDNRPGTALSAEYSLVYAGALAGMGGQEADLAFAEVFRRISKLQEPDHELLFRAHDDYGRYLAGKRAHAAALANYESAERIALEAGMMEDAARVHLCITRIDLESTRDPRLESFRNLKKAAKDLYTAREQQIAWIQYCEDMKEAEQIRVAARHGSVASSEYFRGVLSSIRRSSNEAAD